MRFLHIVTAATTTLLGISLTGCLAVGTIEEPDNGGGTGTNTSGADTAPSKCPDMCTKIAANLCTRDDPMPECVTRCLRDANNAAMAGCGKQHTAYVDCYVNSTFVCDNDQISSTADCESQELNWGTCLAHPRDAGTQRD
jgi:hypothetical protein